MGLLKQYNIHFIVLCKAFRMTVIYIIVFSPEVESVQLVLKLDIQDWTSRHLYLKGIFSLTIKNIQNELQYDFNILLAAGKNRKV